MAWRGRKDGGARIDRNRSGSDWLGMEGGINQRLIRDGSLPAARRKRFHFMRLGCNCLVGLVLLGVMRVTRLRN